MRFIRYEKGIDGLRVPFLVVNLVDPLVDAGRVSQVIGATISSLDYSEVASFSPDALYDFRSQRPIVTYDDGRVSELDMPGMHLSLITDVSGHNFLYLHGQEPDFRWPSLAQDFLDVVKRFGVERVFSFAALPAPVPHTRPADMIIRTTESQENPSVVEGHAEHFGTLTDVFEYKAGQANIPVTNIRVRVPLYMMRGEHPFFAGALAALKMVANLGGPTLPVGDLEQLHDRQAEELESLVEEGSDFAELLTTLESEYDKIPSGLGLVSPAEAAPAIPSAEEIGRAAEAFLAISEENPLDRAIGKKKKETEINGHPDSPRIPGDVNEEK